MASRSTIELTKVLSLLVLTGAAGCADDGGGAQDESDASGEVGTLGSEAGEESAEGESSADGEAESGDASETQGEAESGDGDGDGDGDVTCAPVDPGATWIGSACGSDNDCGFAGGFCLEAVDGFPCGTCSQDCETTCPDASGEPTTFCVDPLSLDVDPADPLPGTCLQQCDPSILGGDGCREDYGCAVMPRPNDNGTQKGVCVPDAFVPEPTQCQADLQAAGVSYVPTFRAPDSPDGFPNLECLIEDPVWLYPPIHDVDWRYYDAATTAPILVSCDMAKAIEHMTQIIDNMDGATFLHIGTYNCRVIGDGPDISEHGYARAIDLYGFELDNGETYTLIDDWEHDVADPASEGGAWLKNFADTRFAEGVFNIILTPNFNAAHDNHFHVDLKPGSSFYD